MLDHDLGLARECIEEIYTNVQFKFNKDEQDKIMLELEQLKKKLSRINDPRADAIQYNALMLPKAIELLRSIDRELMQLMHKYKMIFPKIESMGGLDRLSKRYGLPGGKA